MTQALGLHLQVHAAEQAARLRLKEASRKQQEAAAAAEAGHKSQRDAVKVLKDLELQEAKLEQQVSHRQLPLMKGTSFSALLQSSMQGSPSGRLSCQGSGAVC